MKKYLYFASAAPDSTTSTEQVIMIEESSVSHYEMRNATDLRIYLKETVGQEVEVLRSSCNGKNFVGAKNSNFADM